MAAPSVAAEQAEDAMNDGDLIVEARALGDVPFVVARGDVDLCTTPKLREVLEQSCSTRSGAGPLGIDLRAVNFIDSAGLALLVEMRKRFVQTCQLTLVLAAGSQPERVLKLGRFDTFLRVCYSPDEVTGGGASAVVSA